MPIRINRVIMEQISNVLRGIYLLNKESVIQNVANFDRLKQGIYLPRE